jgi:hypothetical protein
MKSNRKRHFASYQASPDLSIQQYSTREIEIKKKKKKSK